MLIESSKVKVLDGAAEIIYSGDFNVYEDKLTITGILDLTFIFLFQKDSLKPESIFNVKGEGKVVNVTLTNFSNVLGVATPKALQLVKTNDGRELSFSIHAKTVSDVTKLIKVSVTFYLK